jgi:hypothetical protein
MYSAIYRGWCLYIDMNSLNSDTRTQAHAHARRTMIYDGGDGKMIYRVHRGCDTVIRNHGMVLGILSVYHAHVSVCTVIDGCSVGGYSVGGRGWGGDRERGREGGIGGDSGWDSRSR